MNRLWDWAKRLRREMVALWFCARHPGTPFIAKVIATAVVAYAFSPIDLVPDFIPVLGYVDDLVILPIGFWLVLKLVPGPVLAQCREQAAHWLARGGARPRSRTGAVIVIAPWALLLWLGWRWAQTWLAY
jgi:uncharacterized membrane protein YkvA (DUF1232 family)